MFKSRVSLLACATVLVFFSKQLPAAPQWTLQDTGEQASDPNTVEICGVAAGPFQADEWTSHPPYHLPDVRHPLLEPRAGKWRNIYAPSAVAMADGSHTIYYGAWDGIDIGKDHIYVTTTSDFLEIGPRSTVVAPGKFQHVCNVNAEPDPEDPLNMNLMCTLYPDLADKNKPALFKLPRPRPDAVTTATAANFVAIEGYPDYAKADINGMNVSLRDGDRRLLYFGDFHNFNGVHVSQQEASSTTTAFKYIGQAMRGSYAVNDVKLLHDPADPADKPWYLMGLHMNWGQVYYSISRDPLSFPPPTDLTSSLNAQDKHMVAIGFVTDKAYGATRVLGFLYGAGAAPTLDANRIFARWFQKKLNFEQDGPNATAPSINGARGPDRVVVDIGSAEWKGPMSVADETKDGSSANVTLLKSHVYQVVWERD